MTPLAEGDINNKDARISRRDLFPRPSHSLLVPGMARLTIYLSGGIDPADLRLGDYHRDLQYVYSGNLEWQSNYVREWRKARTTVGTSMSPAFFEQLLKNVMNDPKLELHHLLSGVEFGTPDKKPYQILGYKNNPEA